MQVKLKRNIDNTYTVMVDGEANEDFLIWRHGNKAEYDVWFKDQEMGCFVTQAHIKFIIGRMLEERMTDDGKTMGNFGSQDRNGNA